MKFVSLVIVKNILVLLPAAARLMLMHTAADCNIFVLHAQHVVLGSYECFIRMLAFKKVLEEDCVELLGCLLENLVLRVDGDDRLCAMFMQDLSQPTAVAGRDDNHLRLDVLPVKHRLQSLFVKLVSQVRFLLIFKTEPAVSLFVLNSHLPVAEDKENLDRLDEQLE